MWSGFWQGEGGEQTCSTGLGWILVTRSAAPSWCLAGTARPLLFHGVTPAGWGGGAPYKAAQGPYGYKCGSGSAV